MAKTKLLNFRKMGKMSTGTNICHTSVRRRGDVALSYSFRVQKTQTDIVVIVLAASRALSYLDWLAFEVTFCHFRCRIRWRISVRWWTEWSVVLQCIRRSIARFSSSKSSSAGWLGSRVVSVLDSGAEGPVFKSQSRGCRVTVLSKLFTPIVPLFTKQQNW